MKSYTCSTAKCISTRILNHREGVTCGRDPHILIVIIALAGHRDLLGYQEVTVETYTELPNQVDITATRQCFGKFECS